MVPIRYNFRSVIERRATSLMTILGVALVSMIFIIVFGFSAGLKQSLRNAGEDRNVIVLARGVTNENESFVPHTGNRDSPCASGNRHRPTPSAAAIARKYRRRERQPDARRQGIRAAARRRANRLRSASEPSSGRGTLAGARQRRMGGWATAAFRASRIFSPARLFTMSIAIGKSSVCLPTTTARANRNSGLTSTT